VLFVAIGIIIGVLGYVLFQVMAGSLATFEEDAKKSVAKPDCAAEG